MIYRETCVVIATVLITVLCGCQPVKVGPNKFSSGNFDYEGWAERMALEVRKAASVVDTIHNKNSSRAASKKLEAVFGRMADLVDEAENVPMPPDEVAEKVEAILAEAQAEFASACSGIQGTITRYPTIGAMLDGATQKAFGKYISERRPGFSFR